MVSHRHGPAGRRSWPRPIVNILLMVVASASPMVARATDDDCAHVPPTRELHVYEYNDMYYLQSPGSTKKFHLNKNHAMRWSITSIDAIDSATVTFQGATPFSSPWFSFTNDAAVCSGLPVVDSSATVYNYILNVYPKKWKGQARTVDPGIIIDGPSEP